VGVQDRVEPLFGKPALDLLDRVPPLVARQQRVEAVEHLGGVPLLAGHVIDAEERQVLAAPPVALLEEELHDRVEAEHDRMGDQAQQARRQPVPLPLDNPG
jgi:hypothetical protein